MHEGMLSEPGTQYDAEMLLYLWVEQMLRRPTQHTVYTFTPPQCDSKQQQEQHTTHTYCSVFGPTATSCNDQVIR